MDRIAELNNEIQLNKRTGADFKRRRERTIGVDRSTLRP